MIKVTNVTKLYGKIKAVDDISFEVNNRRNSRTTWA